MSLHKDFFNRIDNSRPFLVVAESDHDSTEIKAFLNSREFLEEAKRHGYSKILTEWNQEETAHNRGLAADDPNKRFPHAPSYPEIKIVGVDPRDEEYKNSVHKTARTLQQLSDENDKSQQSKREWHLNHAAIMKVAQQELSRTRTLDDQLLQKIHSEQPDGQKIIIIYGAGHFEEGSILETGISKDQRHIIALGDGKKDLHADMSFDAGLFYVTNSPRHSSGYSRLPEGFRNTPDVKSSIAADPVQQIGNSSLDAIKTAPTKPVHTSKAGALNWCDL